MGGETASKIGSSAAAFQPFCGQLENKRVQTPRDTCAEFGEACVAGSGRFQVMLHLKPPSMPLIATVGPSQCRKSSTITPRRSPGPWFLAGAPSKLSIRPASTLTRPPRCNDFQLFERLKLSAGLGAYPPYCPHRFLCSGVPTSRIAHHVVGERFGASRNVVLPRFFLAHRLGRPLERSEIAWGCLWVRLGCARGQNKIAFNRDSRVFAVFSAPLRP